MSVKIAKFTFYELKRKNMLNRFYEITCYIKNSTRSWRYNALNGSLYLAAVLCLWLPGFVQAQCDEIKKAHDAKFKWMQEQQLDSLAMVLHEQLTYIHSNGWMESRNEVLDNLATAHLIYENVEYEILKCTTIGNMGIIHGEGIFSVRLEGAPIVIKLLYSEVYVRNGDKWLLIARHANKKA